MIDVLTVMGRAIRSISAQSKLSDDGAAHLADEVHKSRIAVAELIEAAQNVIDGTVNASTYPDGPCIDREERDRLKAAIARMGSIA